MLGLRCSKGFSLVVASRGLLFNYAAWASQCNGFSYCGAWILGMRASVVAAPGL